MRPATLAQYGLWLPLAFMAISTVIPPFGRMALKEIAVWAVMVIFFGAMATPFGSLTVAKGVTAAAMFGAVASSDHDRRGHVRREY